MKKILSIFVLTLSIQASAQVMTLKECREAALKNNVNVAIAAEKSQKASYDERAYYANFLPNVKLMGGALYNSWNKNYHFGLENNALAVSLMQHLAQAFPDLAPQLAGFSGFDIKAKTGVMYAGGLTVTQPIYMGGKITAAHDMSMIAKDMTAQNERLTANQVIVGTDEAYVLCVKAKEMRQVAQKYNEMLQELLRVVQSGHKNGMVPQNDVLRVQVKLNESKLQMNKADNAIRLARMNLCHAIGAPLDAPIEVADEYPSDNELVNTLEAGIQNRPEYALLNSQVALADKQIKLAKSDFLPNVALMLGGGYANGLQLNNKSLIDSFSFNALLTVSVPIFHFGEGSNKVKSARAQKAIAEMQQRDLNDQMQLELAQATNNLDEAKQEVELTENSLQQADENLRMTTSQYKAGMATLADNLEAQTLWQNAYEANVEAKFQQYLMRTKYLKAAGLLSGR